MNAHILHANIIVLMISFRVEFCKVEQYMYVNIEVVLDRNAWK